MADINDFSVTDDVTDNLASYHNRLLGGILRAEFVNTETISATKELADSDCQFQVFTASSTDRVVELAPEGDDNHITIIYNATPSTDGHNLVIKDDSGSTTYRTLAPDEWSMFIPISGEGWKQLAPDQDTDTDTDTVAWDVGVQGSTATNPADGTTYYFGAFSTGWQTTIGNTKIRVPRTGTLTSASLLIIAGGAGSTDLSTVSFRLNDTSDTTISNAVDLSTSPYEVVNVAMNVAVTAGDWFAVKWVTPAWGTNPTSVSLSCRLFFTA